MLIRGGSRGIPAEDIALIFREDGTVDLLIPSAAEDHLVSKQGMVAGALYTLVQDRDEGLANIVKERLRLLAKFMETLKAEENNECPTN